MSKVGKFILVVTGGLAIGAAAVAVPSVLISNAKKNQAARDANKALVAQNDALLKQIDDAIAKINNAKLGYELEWMKNPSVTNSAASLKEQNTVYDKEGKLLAKDKYAEIKSKAQDLLDKLSVSVNNLPTLQNINEVDRLLAQLEALIKEAKTGYEPLITEANNVKEDQKLSLDLSEFLAVKSQIEKELQKELDRLNQFKQDASTNSTLITQGKENKTISRLDSSKVKDEVSKLQQLLLEANINTVNKFKESVANKYNKINSESLKELKEQIEQAKAKYPNAERIAQFEEQYTQLEALQKDKYTVASKEGFNSAEFLNEFNNKVKSQLGYLQAFLEKEDAKVTLNAYNTALAETKALLEAAKTKVAETQFADSKYGTVLNQFVSDEIPTSFSNRLSSIESSIAEILGSVSKALSEQNPTLAPSKDSLKYITEATEKLATLAESLKQFPTIIDKYIKQDKIEAETKRIVEQKAHAKETYEVIKKSYDDLKFKELLAKAKEAIENFGKVEEKENENPEDRPEPKVLNESTKAILNNVLKVYEQQYQGVEDKFKVVEALVLKALNPESPYITPGVQNLYDLSEYVKEMKEFEAKVKDFENYVAGAYQRQQKLKAQKVLAKYDDVVAQLAKMQKDALKAIKDAKLSKELTKVLNDIINNYVAQAKAAQDGLVDKVATLRLGSLEDRTQYTPQNMVMDIVNKGIEKLQSILDKMSQYPNGITQAKINEASKAKADFTKQWENVNNLYQEFGKVMTLDEAKVAEFEKLYPIDKSYNQTWKKAIDELKDVVPTMSTPEYEINAKNVDDVTKVAKKLADLDTRITKRHDYIIKDFAKKSTELLKPLEVKINAFKTLAKENGLDTNGFDFTAIDAKVTELKAELNPATLLNAFNKYNELVTLDNYMAQRNIELQDIVKEFNKSKDTYAKNSAYNEKTAKEKISQALNKISKLSNPSQNEITQIFDRLKAYFEKLDDVVALNKINKEFEFSKNLIKEAREELKKANLVDPAEKLLSRLIDKYAANIEGVRDLNAEHLWLLNKYANEENSSVHSTKVTNPDGTISNPFLEDLTGDIRDALAKINYDIAGLIKVLIPQAVEKYGTKKVEVSEEKPSVSTPAPESKPTEEIPSADQPADQPATPAEGKESESETTSQPAVSTPEENNKKDSEVTSSTTDSKETETNGGSTVSKPSDTKPADSNSDNEVVTQPEKTDQGTSAPATTPDEKELKAGETTTTTGDTSDKEESKPVVGGMDNPGNTEKQPVTEPTNNPSVEASSDPSENKEPSQPITTSNTGQPTAPSGGNEEKTTTDEHTKPEAIPSLEEQLANSPFEAGGMDNSAEKFDQISETAKAKAKKLSKGFFQLYKNGNWIGVSSGRTGNNNKIFKLRDDVEIDKNISPTIKKDGSTIKWKGSIDNENRTLTIEYKEVSTNEVHTLTIKFEKATESKEA
ncbi:hypothetical protein [Mycoplasmopsis verecunda]|uniref:Chromosome segregation ATPase n=1 Tax=Mycoplasmopsis verecunda TaxID=171291 RepID=A0A1T4L4L0_9BACT|nr:hypothetical protein [Mycoplasmopsis verecunda]WPB54436.1 hypothetical protein SAM46_03035 [Mycoplasmopsis verecunda]SJZ49481.1 Chromosome segregation ATPase [Mycoplasmopsis verecunda]